MQSAKFKTIAALCIYCKEYENRKEKTKSVPNLFLLKKNDKLLPLDKVMEILGFRHLIFTERTWIEIHKKYNLVCIIEMVGRKSKHVR